MGAPKKYTVDQIEVELRKVHGAITLAAENMGASHNTIRRYIERSAHLRQVLAHYRERKVDTAELKLEAAISNGEPWAIALTLKTLGRNRGYVERQELTGADGEPMHIKVVLRANDGSDASVSSLGPGQGAE